MSAKASVELARDRESWSDLFMTTIYSTININDSSRLPVRILLLLKASYNYESDSGPVA
jgi:hypothetical protein